MEIKGYIEEGESRSLTCCNSLNDILIDKKSLFDILENHFKLDTAEFFDNRDIKTPLLGVSYVILDETPKNKDITFNDLAAEVQFNMLYAEYVSGCYSEFTCGYGGFDYLIKKEKEGLEEGHSIFAELNSYIGKYIFLNIKSIRATKIDKILKQI